MLISGPAGDLEAMLDTPNPASAPLAILCHPHPQYGGNMHDAVLATVSTVLHEHGYNTLRFNFRGVGASAGSYGEGRGEVDDLLAMHAWAQAQNPSAICWIGYSFGASVVWHSAAQIQPQRMLLIAPATAVMPFADHSTDAPVAAIAGDRDDYVDAGTLGTLCGERVQILSGADHFFSGQHGALSAAVTDWLND